MTRCVLYLIGQEEPEHDWQLDPPHVGDVFKLNDDAWSIVSREWNINTGQLIVYAEKRS